MHLTNMLLLIPTTLSVIETTTQISTPNHAIHTTKLSTQHQTNAHSITLGQVGREHQQQSVVGPAEPLHTAALIPDTPLGIHHLAAKAAAMACVPISCRELHCTQAQRCKQVASCWQQLPLQATWCYTQCLHVMLFCMQPLC